MNQVVFRESYGSSQVKKVYLRTQDGSLVVTDESPKFTSISQFFRSVFLPQGYPESVSSDYFIYQFWDTVQAFASSITGTLAAQAVLKGVGVGDESATVLAATMTWLLKDGTGMLGRIIFAWLKGTHLDCDAKRWRLFADILNDFAIFLEILAPSFKPYFTPIVCTAGVCKSIVGVAGGATRAALTQHQARRNNMADVSAKDGSQETLVNLAALVCSMILVPMVTGKDLVIWTLFALFTFLHLFANYSAVTSVVMETLNQTRLHFLVKSYIKDGVIGNPESVNYQEPVVWGLRRKFQVNLGVSIGKVCKSVKDIQIAESIYSKSQYIIGLDLSTMQINIVLNEHSTTSDQLEACYTAEVLEVIHSLKNAPNQKNLSNLRYILDGFEEKNIHKILYQCQSFVKWSYKGFLEALQTENWNTDTVLLCAEEWRAVWQHSGLSNKKD